MLTESLLLSLSQLATLTGGILISKFLARRLPDLLRPLRRAKTTQQEGASKVDTKTLVVGQDVYMFLDSYPKWFCNQAGKAVRVTPTGVEVQTAGELLRFDNDGYELDVSRRERLGFGPSPGDRFHNSLWFNAPEFQPWHLDDMPFVERTALLEQKAQRFRKWDSMDCEHSKIGEHYYIEKCTICGCDNPNYNPTAAKDRLQGKLPK